MGGSSKDLETRPRLLTPAFGMVMLANFAYFLSVGALIPTLPRYVEGPLDAGNLAVGLTIGSFALSAILLRPLAGRIGDQRGRRVLIIWGGLIVAVSVAGYVVASSLWPLLLLRLVSGIGEALFYTGAASAINDLAPDERRGEALSYFSLSLFGGIGLGPILGESVLDTFGFDATWWLAATVAAISGGIGFLVADTRPELDKERKSTRRLLHPAALLPGTVLAASIWGLATFMAFVPLYVLDLGLTGSRFYFTLHAVIVFAIRLVGATIPDRLGAPSAARGALACSVVGFATIAAWESAIGLLVGTIVWSMGHSLAFPALMSMAVRAAPVSERGSVIGTFTAFFDLSFGLGAMTAGGIAEVLGYRGSFAASAVVAVAGLVLLRARGRNGPTGTDEVPATLESATWRP